MPTLFELALMAYLVLGSTSLGWLVLRKMEFKKSNSAKIIYSAGYGLVISGVILVLGYMLDFALNWKTSWIAITGLASALLVVITFIQFIKPKTEQTVQKTEQKYEPKQKIQYQEEIPELTEKEKIKQIILEKAKKSMEEEQFRKETEKQKRIEERKQKEETQKQASENLQDEQKLLEKELEERLKVKEKPEESIQKIETKAFPEKKIEPKVEPVNPVEEQSAEKSTEEKLEVLRKLREKLQKMSQTKTEGQTKPWEIQHALGIEEKEMSENETQRIQEINQGKTIKKDRINVKKLKSGLEEITIDEPISERIPEKVQEFQKREEQKQETKKVREGLFDKLKKLGKKE
ncbi:MAG: hypothetical protein Q7S92_07225 [Candidatus Diapherotrites archaeon]|nr:hypothetical protein [Candidatus Diapherotrites archaeon]